MLANTALKKTGKARLSTWLDGAYIYLKKNKIYLKGIGGYDNPYSSETLLCDDWQPYHEVKEIRPENAEEFWRHDEDGCYITKNRYTKTCDIRRLTDNLVMVAAIADAAHVDIQKRTDIAHNKNGWTRLFPPVENEDVKEIECTRCSGIGYLGRPSFKNKCAKCDGEGTIKVEDDSVDILKLASDVGPLPEEDVERIEIEGVFCKEDSECVYTIEAIFTAPQDLANKPMKMILERSKDKP